MLANYFSHLDPQRARSAVYLIQVLLGASFVVGFFVLRGRDSQSGFRVREHETRKKAPSFRVEDPLGRAKLSSPGQRQDAQKKGQPLRLAGISIQGAPHEILGVAPNASAKEIQKAYRDLMKRYHPDVIGRPGSREWQDAQKIAEALNRAKDALLCARK